MSDFHIPLGRRISVRLSAAVLATALSTAAAGGEVRFNGDGHAYHPVWSLDGKYVAFEVNKYDGSSIDLYFSEVSGDIAKDALKVTLPGGGSGFSGGGAVAVNPSWHPDKIAVFEGSNSGGTYRLYYASPTGSAPAEMLSTSKAPGNLTFPSVSPDGNKLAFVSGDTGNGDLRVWDRSTDKVMQVTSTTSSEMFPQYSADGASLLFTRKKNSAEDMFLLNVSSQQETAVASGNGDQTRPTFAAGGKIVYFTSERGTGIWDIAVVDGDGSNKKVLAKSVALPLRARPALSTDGNWVAYALDDPSKQDSVMLTKVDGSSTVSIATGFKACGEPALSEKDGRVRLAFTALPQSGSDWRFLYVMDITNNL